MAQKGVFCANMLQLKDAAQQTVTQYAAKQCTCAQSDLDTGGGVRL